MTMPAENLVSVRLCSECRNKRRVADEDDRTPCYAVPTAKTLNEAREICQGNRWQFTS